VSRHRRRSIVFGLIGTVLALLGLVRLADGSGAHATSVQRVGRLVTVRPVSAGSRITAADLGVQQIPAAYASVHQLSRPAQALGLRAAVTLAAGAPVMDAELLARPVEWGARVVAVRLDDAAGMPSGDLTDVRADVYVTPPGRHARSRLVLAGVVVLSAAHADAGSVATLLLPRAAVPVAIAAEAEGTLRLVVRFPAGGTP
jgi:Flp pilus assembly protein CpaB